MGREVVRDVSMGWGRGRLGIGPEDPVAVIKTPQVLLPNSKW